MRMTPTAFSSSSIRGTATASRKKRLAITAGENITSSMLPRSSVHADDCSFSARASMASGPPGVSIIITTAMMSIPMTTRASKKRAKDVVIKAPLDSCRIVSRQVISVPDRTSRLPTIDITHPIGRAMPSTYKKGNSIHEMCPAQDMNTPNPMTITNVTMKAIGDGR